MRLGIVLLLSFALIFSDSKQDHSSTLRVFIATLISPLEFAASMPTAIFNWFDTNVTSRSDLIKQLNNLQDERLLLQAQAQTLVSLEAENAHLRQLLGSMERQKSRRTVAEILTVDADPNKHLVTINRGISDGAYLGQPVLDARGVLGQIVDLSMLTSKVLLVSDASHAIPVKVLRNGVRAIAKGSGKPNELILEQLPHTIDLKPGDVLITSGLGMRFPDGFPVAVIRQFISIPGNPFASATATTSTDLSRSGLVILLWPEIPTNKSRGN
ncbi:MAG: rod shape-determining protein MreC [Gammaproteobacteria bacterium]|nr:rod shape-determining protein MreC [Gammaproteobacteria bacterium]